MRKWLSYTNTTITSSVGCASVGVKSLAPCSTAWASPVRCESTQQNLGELCGFAVKVCFRFGRPWMDSCDQNSVAWWHVLLGKADLSAGSHLSSRKETYLVEEKCVIYTKRSKSGLCHHQQTGEETKTEIRNSFQRDCSQKDFEEVCAGFMVLHKFICSLLQTLSLNVNLVRNWSGDLQRTNYDRNCKNRSDVIFPPC